MKNQEDLIKFLANFDESKREHMLNVYISSLNNHTNVCRAALSKEAGVNDLIGSAHDLKSIFRTLGAFQQGDLAEKIEIELKENGLREDVEKDVDRLLDMTAEMVNAMMFLLKDLS